MKILDNTKSLSTLVSDNSNGLGQIQPLSCVVTEELNGIYELDFTVNVNDKHYNDLKNSGLVKVTVGDGSEQIFRIYKIDEPINMISSVHCQHITYDLSKVVVKPFTATGAVNIKNQLVSNMLGSYPFSTWTDITNTTSTFTNDIPRYFRECLGGYEGSVLDVLRPEYEWDNLTVKMYARRGADNGVRISYGKNLIDYSQEQNNENVYDGVYGYAVVDEVTYKADSYFNKTGATYPRILNVDFSSDYESGQIPTPSELLQKATTYAQNNSIEVPSINIKIEFVPLWQTEEYKNILPLERVSLGDTVHVFFDKLNVEASARVIKTEWNVLTEKYDSIELGDAKANLNTIINDSVSTAVDEAVSDLDIDVGWLDTKAENMFKLIANGVGLHITKDSRGRIILHNDEDLSRSKYQYMITAQGFMMSDDYGQEGSWRSGWTTSGDAYMNSLSTITLRALDIYGSYIYGTDVQGSRIIFGDPNDTSGKYITAQQYDADDDTNYDGVSFDGTGYVRFQPQEQFIVNNLDANSNLLNEFILGSNGTYGQAFVTLKNYDHNNHLLANSIDMDDNYYDTGGYSTRYNRLELENYKTSTGTQYLSNQLSLEARPSKNRTFIANKLFQNGEKDANTIEMQSHSTSSNYIDITNYNYNGEKKANRLEWYATSAVTFSSMDNYQPTSSGLANRLQMRGSVVGSGDSSGNFIKLENYNVDNSNDEVSTRIELQKTRNENAIRMQVLRSGYNIAYINISRDSSADVSISLTIPNQTVNGKQYNGCSIDMYSSSGKLFLYGSGGVYANNTQIG